MYHIQIEKKEANASGINYFRTDFIQLIHIKCTEIYTLNYTKTFFFWLRKVQFVISVIPERAILSLEKCVDRLCKRAGK